MVTDVQGTGQPRFGELDGLRAVAVTLVMLFHARCFVIPGAFAGVDIFFVLSGFLITRLLVNEQRTQGQIDLVAFYIRRATRLVPALALMLAVYLVVAPWVWPGAHHVGQAGLAFFYASDYARAFWGVPRYLTHTWSLSVEEHFYLLWPLVVRWLAGLGRDRALVLLVGLYVSAWLWRSGFLWYGQSWDALYYRFDTRVSGLFMGAIVALLLEKARSIPQGRLLGAAAWGVMGLTLMSSYWGSDDFWLRQLPLLEIASAVIIATLVMRSSSRKHVLGLPPFRFVGRISYGMYLWHYPIFYFMRESYPWPVTFMLGGAVTVLLAWVSSVTVERWGFRMRDRWLARRRAGMIVAAS